MSHPVLRSRIVYFFRSEEDDSLQLLLANNSQSKEGTSPRTQPSTSVSSPKTTTTSSSRPTTKSASLTSPTSPKWKSSVKNKVPALPSTPQSISRLPVKWRKSTEKRSKKSMSRRKTKKAPAKWMWKARKITRKTSISQLASNPSNSIMNSLQ